MKHSTSFGRMAGDERGNIAMMFGLLLFIILGAAGIAIDITRASMKRTEIAEAADAGILAAARYKANNPNANDDDLTAITRKVFDSGVKDKSSIVIKDFRITHNADAGTFALDVDGGMNALIMGVMGQKYIDVGARTEVKAGRPPLLEVALALDVTGSMSKNGRMSAMKKSATDLVDTLFEAGDADVKVGIVPFAQYVNVGSGHASEAWLKDPGKGWFGCVGSRGYPRDVQDADYLVVPAEGVITDNKECPKALTPLTNDDVDLKKSIAGFAPDGYTYIPSGLLWGWSLLTPAEPFAEGVSFAKLKAEDGVKALVLMTDGYNTRAPDYPKHDSGDVLLANDRTKEICANVKKDEIVVYTIAFELTDTTIKGILEACATSPAHYFDATNSNELSNAFASIATSLRKISLSK